MLELEALINLSRRETRMSQNKFQSIIMQYCRSAGQKNSADLILDGHPLSVDGVIFSLDYNPSETPDHFTVYCDMGAVSGIETVKVQGALLRMNTVFYMTHGLCLTVSPTKKEHVICSLNFPLDDLSAKTFGSTLEALAKFSHEWKHQWPENFARFSVTPTVAAT
jgi:hypothetical protein